MVIRACAVIAALTSMGGSDVAPLADVRLIVIFCLAWAAITLGAFLLNLPRTRFGYYALMALDLAIAGAILLLGIPLAAIPLLVAGGFVWRALGGQGVISPPLILYLMMWMGVWIIRPELVPAWITNHPTYADIFRLVPPSLALAWLTRAEVRRRDMIRRLREGIQIDPVATTKQPFAYDFTEWAQQVAGLYGDDASNCAIFFVSRTGTFQLFGRLPDNPDRAGLARLSKEAEDWPPDHFTIAQDRSRPPSAESAEFARKLSTHLHLKRNVLAVRSVQIGSHRGMAVIAVDAPGDALLLGELAQIDAALDEVIARASETMEMRRGFLAEAREVARRDLHDGVLQSLAAIRMRLLSMLNEKELQDSPSAPEIRTTADIIALEQSRLRNLLESDGEHSRTANLVAALRLAAKALSLQWEVQIDLVTDEVAIPMHNEAVNNIEHLFREVVANAMRHSRTKHISCALAIREADLVLSLVDSAADAAENGTPVSKGNPLESQSLIQRLTLVNGRAYSEGLSGGRLLAIAIPLVYEEDD